MRDANQNREEKIFFRVTRDGLSERGTTRGLLKTSTFSCFFPLRSEMKESIIKPRDGQVASDYKRKMPNRQSFFAILERQGERGVVDLSLLNPIFPTFSAIFWLTD